MPVGIVNGRRYDTETATKIGHWSNGHYPGDFARCEETLYRTPKGNFFLYGEGGAMSKYATPVGNMRGGGSNIEPMDETAAAVWCEEHCDAAVVVEHFPNYVEDA